MSYLTIRHAEMLYGLPTKGGEVITEEQAYRPVDRNSLQTKGAEVMTEEQAYRPVD